MHKAENHVPKKSLVAIASSIVMLSAAIPIQVRRPRQFTYTEWQFTYHERRIYYRSIKIKVPSVALCIIFKVKLIIKEKQFTVHMVGYPEESVVLRSDNYEEFYCKGLFSGNIKLF